MDKFKVTMTLGSPIVSNGGYMTLDALLAALIFDQTSDLEQAHTAVPLVNTDGLWHGSAAIVEKTDVGRVSFVANLQATHDLDLNLIAKNKQGNAHTAIGLTRRRDFGAVMNSYKIFTAPSITWYAQGDAEAVELLLRDVAFIGKRRASGYGQVMGISVEADELDGVTGFFGEPLRPVPVTLFQGNDTALRADAAWRPAYWHPANRAICFVPEGV
ncbi:MAG: hypothetical protein ACRERX_11895 [Pseudomonas sp.]